MDEQMLAYLFSEYTQEPSAQLSDLINYQDQNKEATDNLNNLNYGEHYTNT